MKKLTINNLEVMLPTPYITGHQCTPAEAGALNTTLHRRIRDRLDRRFGRRTEFTQEMQLAVHNIIRTTSINGNPVGAEAKTIALNMVKRAIKDEGQLIKSYTPREMKERAENLLKSPAGRAIVNLAINRITEIEEAAQGLGVDKVGIEA